jgi:hypothetical protein
MDKFVSGTQVATVSGGPVQGAVFMKEQGILKSIQRQLFSSKYNSVSNPKGQSPKQKVGDEMEDYITTSGY